METSTPLVRSPAKRDLHRRTLLRNAVEASPLRRRSVLDTTVHLLEKSNDESERSSRRSLVDMQRRLSNLPPGASSPLNESNKFLGEQDMKDHFQICTKLFTENKINAKNAWKLHIIDLLKHMAQKPSTDTLQVASTSLDISAKVYGIRVDDIHSDGMKLASSMARAADKQPPQDMDEDNGDIGDDPENENAAAKKKKKKKSRRMLAGEKNTIAKDPKSLQAPLPKLESVFFSTRINAEASAIDNLFTNMLKTDNSGYKFMLLCKEKAWADLPDPVVQDINIPDRKKYPLTVNRIPNLTLCAPFAAFSVDQWDPDEEEKQLAAEKSLLTQRQDEVIYDDNGIPIPELDGSIHDIFAANNEQDVDDELMDVDDDVHSVHEEIAPQIRGEIARIVEFRPEVTDGLQRSEYSYNSVVSTHSGKVIDQIWAGPSHWKLKFIRRSSARFSGQVTHEVKQKQGRKRIQPQSIQFDREYDEFDLSKKLKIKKKPPSVDIHKITLPIPDSSCIKLMAHIKELMSKPGVCPVKKKAVEEEVDYEVSAYKYENPNDSQYCSQQNGDDGPDDADIAPFDDNFGDDNDAEEHLMAQHQQNFLGDNLVDAPEAIPKSYVPYALQAKKMDMRKLKAAVWQNLTNTTITLTKDTQKSAKVIPTTFSKMFREIPDLLPDKMKQELSCPLAFVALLHLCNEQNLALKQHDGYKDFDIRGPIST